MSTTPYIVWFRLDLRLTDNPALSAASKAGASVIPLFIWDP
ncbi:MAG: deoxyribodipyrimidine photo-lyase, partial [Verrucomicrobia bacterium]|nr:deoxyribodipyrimidine photo-lyase [Verrucomicrobiota bacterium]